MRFAKALLIGVASLVALEGAANATQLVYTPINPTFGGNPLNGTFLLGVAQSQGFGFKAKNVSPDLTGLDAAISSLTSNLGGLSANPSVAAPIIVIGSPTVPTVP
jgi:curli production assembly/transport component CsgF